MMVNLRGSVHTIWWLGLWVDVHRTYWNFYVITDSFKVVGEKP